MTRKQLVCDGCRKRYEEAVASGDQLKIAAHEIGIRTRIEQGLPCHVQDPVALAKIATLLKTERGPS